MNFHEFYFSKTFPKAIRLIESNYPGINPYHALSIFLENPSLLNEGPEGREKVRQHLSNAWQGVKNWWSRDPAERVGKKAGKRASREFDKEQSKHSDIERAIGEYAKHYGEVENFPNDWVRKTVLKGMGEAKRLGVADQIHPNDYIYFNNTDRAKALIAYKAIKANKTTDYPELQNFDSSQFQNDSQLFGQLMNVFVGDKNKFINQRKDKEVSAYRQGQSSKMAAKLARKHGIQTEPTEQPPISQEPARSQPGQNNDNYVQPTRGKRIRNQQDLEGYINMQKNKMQKIIDNLNNVLQRLQ